LASKSWRQNFDLDQGRHHAAGQVLPPQSLKKGGAVKSQVDILYLAVVLLAVGGFAVVLAYYSRS